jgi:hypothetical protein
MTRPQLAQHIVALIGDQVAEMRVVGTGWPSVIEVETALGSRSVALHVSRASPHARRDYEWRFQNPGNRSPVDAPGGSTPILVGVDTVGDTEVLIVVDGTTRLGRDARFSILYNKRLAREAARTGWSEQVTGTGERIFGMLPQLFPAFLEMLSADILLPTPAVISAVQSSGLLDGEAPASAERARKTVSTYVRDARFSKEVRIAYGHRCAMCGVGLGLIAGAHIMPVSAPGSADRVWNGLALCHNHHAAFDAFNIWADSDFSIRIRPGFSAAAAKQPESVAFLASTLPNLRLPDRAQQRPRRDMLIGRYGYFAEEYGWAPAVR